MTVAERSGATLAEVIAFVRQPRSGNSKIRRALDWLQMDGTDREALLFFAEWLGSQRVAAFSLSAERIAALSPKVRAAYLRGKAPEVSERVSEV